MAIRAYSLVILLVALCAWAPSSSNAAPIPDFDQHATITSVNDGNWDEASTWSPARVPNSADIVSVLNGHEVVIRTTDAEATAVGIHGLLRFDENANTKIVVGTLQANLGGELRIGDCRDANAWKPIEAGFTAEVEWKGFLDTTFDPEQFGIGLIGQGKVTVCGGEKMAFSRLKQELAADVPSFNLVDDIEAGNWMTGDRLIIPDSRAFYVRIDIDGLQLEQAAVSSVSGHKVTLKENTIYAHPGARLPEGELELHSNGNAKYVGHVLNVQRNVMFYTSPSALEAGSTDRGHALFFETCDVSIRYASFHDMGRTLNGDIDSTTFGGPDGSVDHIGTNQLGRYAIHCHHLSGPIPAVQDSVYQFEIIGNVIERSMKWGITIHDAHYGLIQHNIVYNVHGAGYVCEDSSESFNHFDSNFVVWIYGHGGRASDDGFDADIGREGVGFWNRGPNNRFTNNVASNLLTTGPWGFGFSFFMPYTAEVTGGAPNKRVPPYAGAPLDEYILMNMEYTPLLEFNNNEVYGAISGGLTIWWMNLRPSVGGIRKDSVETHIELLTCWNSGLAVYMYDSNRVTFNGAVFRGNAADLSSPYANSKAITNGDYGVINYRVVNSDIQGYRYGIETSVAMTEREPTWDVREYGFELIANNTLYNWINIDVASMWSVGSPEMGPKRIIIDNNDFRTFPLSFECRYDQCPPSVDVRLKFHEECSQNLIERQEIFIKDYKHDGSSPVDLQLYYREQGPDFPVIVSGTCEETRGGSGRDVIAAPAACAGLTNMQCYALFGNEGVMAGEMATCADDYSYTELTTDEIKHNVPGGPDDTKGYACPFDRAVIANLYGHYDMPEPAAAPVYRGRVATMCDAPDKPKNVKVYHKKGKLKVSLKPIDGLHHMIYVKYLDSKFFKLQRPSTETEFKFGQSKIENKLGVTFTNKEWRKAEFKVKVVAVDKRNKAECGKKRKSKAAKEVSLYK
eukprot:TRINITY_DN6239_c0_g2_i1.p1 TRINITY_DN6239_c0_g2~~TRINITY_DN6239_c0_g2_i1.p1  ORF type:complete len:977 (-),score=261.26 TRINITY_DN6239_c0_g2_i1:242-3133(-)